MDFGEADAKKMSFCSQNKVQTLPERRSESDICNRMIFNVWEKQFCVSPIAQLSSLYK